MYQLISAHWRTSSGTSPPHPRTRQSRPACAPPRTPPRSKPRRPRRIRPRPRCMSMSSYQRTSTTLRMAQSGIPIRRYRQRAYTACCERVLISSSMTCVFILRSPCCLVDVDVVAFACAFATSSSRGSLLRSFRLFLLWWFGHCNPLWLQPLRFQMRLERRQSVLGLPELQRFVCNPPRHLLAPLEELELHTRV